MMYALRHLHFAMLADAVARARSCTDGRAYLDCLYEARRIREALHKARPR
jgi:hypothetical protein